MSFKCLHWPPIQISFIMNLCCIDLALTSMIFERCIDAKVYNGDTGRGQGAEERYWAQKSDLFLTDLVSNLGICNQYMHFTSVMYIVYCLSLTSQPKFP